MTEESHQQRLLSLAPRFVFQKAAQASKNTRRCGPTMAPGFIRRISTIGGARGKNSPFTNNDDPTPRVGPSEAEINQLQAEAAMGAGTPGFIKQQQQMVPDEQPTSPRGAEATGASAGCGSRSSTTESLAGQQLPADAAAHVELSRADTDAYDFVVASQKSSGRGEGSSDGKPSPKHSGRKESVKGAAAVGPASPTGQGGLGGLPGSSGGDAQDGLWGGFLNLFRTQRRLSLGGTPMQGSHVSPAIAPTHMCIAYATLDVRAQCSRSNTDAPTPHAVGLHLVSARFEACQEGAGPALGAAQNLPNPDPALPISDAVGDDVLAAHMQEEGRRGQRGVSPHGATAAHPSSSETTDDVCCTLAVSHCSHRTHRRRALGMGMRMDMDSA